MKVAFNFKEGKRRSRKERIWYEESGNRLDPGLIERIYYDRPVSAYLDITDSQIGSAQVRDDHNLSGEGITIAVLDTGIHPHDDLTTPENRIIAFHDVINGETEPYDDNGHGTHCVGDAVGNGAMSDGEYKEPAPEASIVGVKVLNGSGGSKLFNIIEGIEWCMKNKKEYGIQILSLSLGSEAYESFRRDPLSLADQEAWQAGIIVCAGVITLMLEANPDLSPNDVKSILQMTGDPAFGSGWGYIDGGRAVEMAIRQRENRQTSPSADGQ